VSCIGDRLQFVHFKDAREGKLALPGEGELPFAEFIAAFKQIGYDGWISFEWEKMWRPEIPEPEVAFPAFIKAVRPLL
jgi:sugar phosphate isomerase/epimerase